MSGRRRVDLTFNRRFAAAAFLLLLASTIRPSLLRALMGPHAALPAGPADGLDRKPLRLREDPTDRALPAFLEGVRSGTKQGDAIAVLIEPPQDGFSYTYWRAAFLLAGRDVLPPEPHLDREKADWIAAWRRDPGDSRFDLVWSDASGGSLWRRRR